MNAINSILRHATDIIFSPLASWPAMVLVACSAIAGVLMALVFKYTSNQTGMRRVLDRSRGHILGIKLFKDDLRGMFRSLISVCGLMLMRIWYSLVPILVLTIPLVLLMSQMFLRFEHRPLLENEQTILQLDFDEKAWELSENVELTSGDGVTVETTAVRDDEMHSVFWRLRATKVGASNLSCRIKTDARGMEIKKSIVVANPGDVLQQTSTRRPSSSWLDKTLFAGEDHFAKDSPIKSVVVHYPKREVPILGFRIPWWLTFFLVSILAALAAQPILKVRF